MLFSQWNVTRELEESYELEVGFVTHTTTMFIHTNAGAQDRRGWFFLIFLTGAQHLDQAPDLLKCRRKK